MAGVPHEEITEEKRDGGWNKGFYVIFGETDFMMQLGMP